MAGFGRTKEILLSSLASPRITSLFAASVFTAATKSVLQEAVDMYCSSEGKAKAIYGHIARWNVAKITNMSSGKGTFHQLAARGPSR